MSWIHIETVSLSETCDKKILYFFKTTCVDLHDVSAAHLIDEPTHPGAGRQQEQSVREEDEVALGELLRNNSK